MFSLSVVTLVGRQVDFSNRAKFRAIIGSTKCTQDEAQAAYDFARMSVIDGYIVVSGLASGVDASAHLGALSVTGDFVKTVAVLSTSPQEPVYPKGNTVLSESIKANGALIHCYKTIAPWTKERFGPKQKRLVERDVIQACLSGEIYAVSDSEPIEGGTRWALNYGRHLGIPLYRVNSYGVIRADFTYKLEPRLIPWKMELDWEKAYTELRNNNYEYTPL